MFCKNIGDVGDDDNMSMAHSPVKLTVKKSKASQVQPKKAQRNIIQFMKLRDLMTLRGFGGRSSGGLRVGILVLRYSPTLIC